MENVRQQPNQKENWNSVFCITCSNAFQLRSDPEVLFMRPTLPFLLLHIASNGATQKTKPWAWNSHDVEVKENRVGRSLVSGLGRTSGSDASDALL